MTATSTAPRLVVQDLKVNRIHSIDLLRGIVMIIMALDHVRDYFHADAFLFNPLDLSQTNVPLFFTRWITHFCAPVFVFLAGTSAFLVGSRKGKAELSSFLFKRGVWLLVLEFTIINIAWFFNLEFSLIALTVIWALGIGMIVLAAAIHLPFKVILGLGLLFVMGHNLLDPIKMTGSDTPAVLWSLLHEYKGFQLDPFFLFVGYPVIPWTGIMLLGYCFGKFYLPKTDAVFRKKILLRSGVSMIVAFVVLRLINSYGDPFPWSVQKNGVFTFLSFVNVTKYPPSLDYILVMLGPSFIFLALAENLRGKLSQYVIALGRVPMFYYITHLYLIHIIAVIAALATGFEFSDMIFNTWVTDSPNLRGYGFSLAVTYLVWIAVVLALFPLCLWYDRYKTGNKEKWWLSYL
ncbi:MAG TPA: heparan-alpha-glucosaminide N-acetyltransferase domain-containing protein [Chryseosolibacter sp.]